MRMKISVVICTTVLLALLPASVFAQTLTLDKSEYLQGETPIASWTGLPVQGNQMQLYYPNDNVNASYFGWSWLDGSTGGSVDGPADGDLTIIESWVVNDGGTWPLPLGLYYLHIFSPGGSNSWTDVAPPVTFTVVEPPVEPASNITPSSSYPIQGEDFSLHAPGSPGGTSAKGVAAYQWYKEGNLMAGKTNGSLDFEPVHEEFNGTYTVEYDNGLGSKVVVLSDPYVLVVLSPGTSIPVTGLLGLGLLIGACTLGGAAVLRRKN